MRSVFVVPKAAVLRGRKMNRWVKTLILISVEVDEIEMHHGRSCC